MLILLDLIGRFDREKTKHKDLIRILANGANFVKDKHMDRIAHIKFKMI